MLKNMKLSVKLAIVGFIFTGFIVAIVAGIAIYRASSMAEDNANAFMEASSKSNANLVAAEFNRLADSLHAYKIAMESTLDSNIAMPVNIISNMLDDALKESKLAAGIFFYTTDDSIYAKNPNSNDPRYTNAGDLAIYVNYHGRLERIEDNYKSKDYYINGLEKPRLSEPFKDHIEGNQIVMSSMTFPVKYKGKTIGIIGADLNIENFFIDRLKEIKLYKTDTSFLLSNKGIMVANSNPEIRGLPVQQVNPNLAQLFPVINSNQNSYATVTADSKTLNQNVHFNLAKVNINYINEPWSLATLVPTNEIFTQVASARNGLIIVGIVVAIIGGFFLFFATNMLIHRIENIRILLSEFFDFLNHKRADARLAVITNNDEISQMAKVINDNIIIIKSNLDKDSKAVEESLQKANEVEKRQSNC